ncbi:condensation domain-containing protein, partial [Paenibacillus sp. MZ03-122A]|uniref:condensation domain-containing protein n=1 Tax=Paenibacillus sp. MZ03-122A TaxID=2962033 RepID=UPI0020B648BD
FEHQEYPFEELVEKLPLQRDMSRNPLFDTMLVLQNMAQTELQLDGLQIAPFSFENPETQMDLIMNAIEVEEGLFVSINYMSLLFQHQTIERLLAGFRNIMEAIASNPNELIRCIQVEYFGNRTRKIFDFVDF